MLAAVVEPQLGAMAGLHVGATDRALRCTPRPRHRLRSHAVVGDPARLLLDLVPGEHLIEDLLRIPLAAAANAGEAVHLAIGLGAVATARAGAALLRAAIRIVHRA